MMIPRVGRSVTMDKWKDAELEKMRAGGNRQAKDFLTSQSDWQVVSTEAVFQIQIRIKSAS
jgi:hypothetical protein